MRADLKALAEVMKPISDERARELRLQGDTAGVNFEAVRKHFRPLTDDEIEVLAREHGSGPEAAVALAEVLDAETLARLQQFGQPKRGE